MTDSEGSAAASGPGVPGKEFIIAQLPEVMEFRATLDHETDRGCALMAAAYLDSQLENLFRQAWVDNAQIVNEVLGKSKPLGSFSARIDMAFLCGFIGEHGRRDLHLVRKIRNEFGS